MILRYSSAFSAAAVLASTSDSPDINVDKHHINVDKKFQEKRIFLFLKMRQIEKSDKVGEYLKGSTFRTTES